jgi:hypothetical protein
MDQEKKTGRQNFVACNDTYFNKTNITFYYTTIYGKLLKLITQYVTYIVESLECSCEKLRHFKISDRNGVRDDFGSGTISVYNWIYVIYPTGYQPVVQHEDQATTGL